MIPTAYNLSEALNSKVNLLLEGFKLQPSKDIAATAKIIETRFDSVGKGVISDPYEHILNFFNTPEINDYVLFRISGGLCLPIKEKKLRLIDSDFFEYVLQGYKDQLANNNLARMTWYKIAQSYFGFSYIYEPNDNREISLKNLELLRRFLQKSRQYIVESNTKFQPDWIKLINQESQLFEFQATSYYSDFLFNEHNNRLESLKVNFGITDSSWFWDEMISDVTQRVVSSEDTEYKRYIPLILEFLNIHPYHQNVVLSKLLNRMMACQDRNGYEPLRDYIIRPETWGNPKLYKIGKAPAWNNVSESVWQMVMNWVNERNLEAFFHILADRDTTDDTRLEFWMKYIKQISWTRLIVGKRTLNDRKYNKQVKQLLESEKGTLSYLESSDKDKDAFLMQIGNYIFVEFSTYSNACYGYLRNNVQFDYEQAIRLDDSTGAKGLKYGHWGGGISVIKIIHDQRWQIRTTDKLKKYDIYPDDYEEKVANASSYNRGIDSISNNDKYQENVENTSEYKKKKGSIRW